MSDLDAAILRAWNALLPRLRSDPGELARRLARRRTATLLRPPRAWCIAIRAADTRIDPATCPIVPEDALDPNEPDYPMPHTVTLHKKLIQKLCASVMLDGWGEDVHRVARQLGCTTGSIKRARDRGVLRARYVQGLGGRWGNPIPLLNCDHLLDPSGRLKRAPDPIWAGNWEFLPNLLPDDFEQEIERNPTFRRAPDRDFKYEHPKNSIRIDYRGRFNGFVWICPSCRKQARVLYYPMRPLDPTKLLNTHLPISEADDLPPPPPIFACYRCHRVRSTTRANRNDWNKIIAYLTAGLLYGGEVARPSWYTPTRQRAYRPQLHRPAPRRGQVLRRLMNGWSIRRIARDLHIGIRAVGNHIRALCDQERVPNRHMLTRKFGSKHRQPLNQDERARARRKEIQRLILQGKRFKEIMSLLHTDFSTVNRDTWKIYKTHGVSGRRGLANKLGVTLPETRGEKIRERIRALRAEGMTWREVAKQMGMSFHAVDAHAKVIRKDDAQRRFLKRSINV